MSEIASAVVPSLLRDLIEHICRMRQCGVPVGSHWPAFAPSDTLVLSLLSPSASAPEGLASTSGSLSTLPIAQQCEIISTARDFAVAALSSHHQHLLSAVQDHHNRQQPIYRLPNEVLSIIFEFVGTWKPGPLGISHISKLWRQVALNTPSLWTTIHHHNLFLVNLFLHRSKSVPVDLDFSPDRLRLHPTSTQNSLCPQTDATMSGFAWTLRPYAHRLRSLHLSCSGISPRLLGQHLDMPVPMLHSLSVSSLDGRFRYSTAQREMPYNIFDGCTTRLRELILDDVCIPLASPIYTGLASIYLTYVSFIDSSPHDFTRRLAACPSLNHLHLHAVTFDTLAQSSVLHPVHLPHLKAMSFEELERDLICGILNSIKVPDSLRLSLMSLDEATLHDLLPPRADITQNLPNLCATRSLYIYGGQEYSLPKISGTFDFEFAGGGDTFVREVFFSISRIPFPMLKSLTISNLTKYIFDSVLFSHILEHLHTITSLTLERCPAAAAEMLTLTPSLRLCPSLQFIVLDTCRISGATAIAIARSRTSLDYTQGKGQMCLRKLIIRNGVGIDVDVMRTLQEFPIELEMHVDSDYDYADSDSDSESDFGSEPGSDSES
ncbi:hypothetical protein BOTBODRAFT_58485 [Botryobasidium botryosum FD-172 SS1]|uniref:Uncharacterized protein n=1 Tax=Botryobasidium botryosum (strain FD-172 SS1) TaxID=930990 RepID=A0A067M4P9_BOTB1|nr:hypothetical protein BOTBODRAFT_58485 [Botryobasidium botryosum FD-172 SS1]